MPANLLELFSPEVQSFYATLAGGFLVIGLFIWGAGIRLARPALAFLTGVVASGLAFWALPGPTGLSPATAGLIGFVVGLLAGAVTFRFVQAALLALCMAVLVAGMYYRSNVLPARIAATASTNATLPAGEMLIPTERLSGHDIAKRGFDAAAVLEIAQGAKTQAERLARQEWNAMPAFQQQRLGILAGLGALVGLLIALFFPRHTTWLATAALGTAVVAAAGLALLQVLGKQYLALLPTRPVAMLGILAAIMIAGLAVQRLFLWPGRKKPRRNREASTARGSVPGEPATA